MMSAAFGTHSTLGFLNGVLGLERFHADRKQNPL
jgi:hypothetical protein